MDAHTHNEHDTNYIEESKKLPDHEAKKAEREARIAEAEYRKFVRNIVVLAFVAMAATICWWTPKAGADAAYQAYTVEQVAR